MAGPKPSEDTTVKSENIFGQPLTIFGVPVDRETIFTNHKGLYKKKVEQRQRKLIVKSTFIKFFLHHDERIRCLTTGYSPVSVLEQIVTGPSFLFFKRALFIFTDKRILHVPTRFNRSPRSAISQIMYEDCARLTVKGRALHVQYKNGRNDIFPYLGRKEKRKIRALIDSLPLSPKDAGRLQGRVYLCPSCANILPTAVTSCEACKMAFKTPFQAKLRSLLLPGGGYFYARYPLVGVGMTLLDIFLIGFIALQWMNYNKGIPINFGLIALLACGWMVEKLMSAYHTTLLIQDFVPVEKDFAMRKI